ncbi:uncharacterized protein F4812DRAFT_456074 [Daldinia caldariorum]|uniref:uncharacterized protein n=1 Tax=Daldinia caldariorum TaxID=326644 RepID=UPI002007F8AD|nr:uncharacterized protein F4812DRAFT_456074 [Daldinia caldariorum]KAI1471971.1 hypothetical protein F4812DRAFT_456074 [Daldinia caldariorum]
MDGKGSQKRDGRRGRHHTSGSWRKQQDFSHQDYKQGNPQGDQQGDQQGHKSHQQRHKRNPLPDYQPFRAPVREPAQQPPHQQQPDRQQPKQEQPKQELPEQKLPEQQSSQSCHSPSEAPNETQRSHSPKTIASEVDALRRAIEFVGQRNAELHVQFEELKGELSGMKEKYAGLEASIKQNISKLPGGTQLLQAMEEREKQKKRLEIRHALQIPSRPQRTAPPEEKPYIESIIEFCYELLEHEVNVANELRKELALITQKNAELLDRLESESKSKSKPTTKPASRRGNSTAY